MRSQHIAFLDMYRTKKIVTLTTGPPFPWEKWIQLSLNFSSGRLSVTAITFPKGYDSSK